MGRRDEGLLDLAGGMTNQPSHLFAPVGQPRDIDQVGAETSWLGRGELRVARRVLREAVMGEVKGPEIGRWENQDSAADPGDRVVQPARAEGRAVDGLVQGREEEDQDQAVAERGREQPGPARGLRDQPGGDGQRAQVAGIQPWISSAAAWAAAKSSGTSLLPAMT